MASIEKTVFISYRRDDSYEALAVYQFLTNQQYDVFLDYTSIHSGDFEQIIVSNIRARAHFLIILTPTALDRCSEPGDWLRREIETAIDEKRNIIPLFFNGFSFSSPNVVKNLTGKLAALRRYNGLNIPPGYFNEAMTRLSHDFLNVPLDAILLPVPTDMQKAVEEKQIVANQAVEENKRGIEKLVRPVDERAGRAEQEIYVSPPGGTAGKSHSYRLYGGAAGVLLLIIAGIFGLRMMSEKSTPAELPTLIPVQTSTQVPEPTKKIPDSPVGTESTLILTPILPTESATDIPLPTPGVGSTKTSIKDGMTLHFVPAGVFTMGSRSTSGDPDEKPAHTVSLDSFWIDETEVTNAIYAKCVADGGCNPPKETGSNHVPDYYVNTEYASFPVINVVWADANNYCAWAGRRLPSEAEWEKAARGEDEGTYPWGNKMPSAELVNYNNPSGDSTEVGKYPSGISPYGVLDMAGNVWEWTNDWYDQSYYQNSPALNPPGPDSARFRMIRGGSWNDDAKAIRSANRAKLDATAYGHDLGFRCAISE